MKFEHETFSDVSSKRLEVIRTSYFLLVQTNSSITLMNVIWSVHYHYVFVLFDPSYFVLMKKSRKSWQSSVQTLLMPNKKKSFQLWMRQNWGNIFNAKRKHASYVTCSLGVVRSLARLFQIMCQIFSLVVVRDLFFVCRFLVRAEIYVEIRFSKIPFQQRRSSFFSHTHTN